MFNTTIIFNNTTSNIIYRLNNQYIMYDLDSCNAYPIGPIE